MSALRLMTFNVQILPLIASVIQGITNDAEDRANRVADALLALPPDERPHVIAFNEVFDEDGRAVLLDRLRGTWKHVVKTIHDGFPREDSGLMLFSSLPFLTLPMGGVWYEKFYTDAADDDVGASKAVGVVQVGLPAEITTIAFTHMQASYTSDEQYSDVRRNQLQTIYEAITDVVGSGHDAWRNVILVGDLNIRGNLKPESTEWVSVFETPGLDLTTELLDGWQTYMHPPQDPQTYDLGFTNIDFPSNEQRRLDYHCYPKQGIPARALVPHHMFQRFRQQGSDHFSLEAVVQRWSPHCTPSDAIKLMEVSIVGGAVTGVPSNTRRVDLNIADPGSMQWIYVDKPGTFTVHEVPGLDVRLFLRSDLTLPVKPVDTLVISELPSQLSEAFRESFETKGNTFALREAFFIAVRFSTNDPGPTAIKIMVTEHLGESAATAIWLAPHVKRMTGHPLNQKLGIDDRCWFKAKLPPTFAGVPREERFRADNETGMELKLSEVDGVGQESDSARGAQSALFIVKNTTGDETVILTLERETIAVNNFSMTWISPLSYLMLDRPIDLYIKKETGGLGSDEVRFELIVDGSQIFQGFWDDADTGERWPGLFQAIAARVALQFPNITRIAFAENIAISYVEEDISASGYLSEFLNPLSPSELDIVNRQIDLPVPDTLGDGLYTFSCSISRFE